MSLVQKVSNAITVAKQNKNFCHYFGELYNNENFSKDDNTVEAKAAIDAVVSEFSNPEVVKAFMDEWQKARINTSEYDDIHLALKKALNKVTEN